MAVVVGSFGAPFLKCLDCVAAAELFLVAAGSRGPGGQSMAWVRRCDRTLPHGFCQ